MATYGGTPASQPAPGATPAASSSAGGNVYNSYYTILGGASGVDAVVAITHSASGSVALDWSAGSNWRVTSAGYNVTGLTDSNGPSAGFMRTGTVEIVNTGAAGLAVDFTDMPHGLESVVTIPAGQSDMFIVWSTP